MSRDIINTPDGYAWYYEGDDDHLALGGHEAGLYPVLAGMSNPDKVFVNVGAHVGLWAIRMAKHFKQVVAIEANPLTFKKLTDNITLNNVDNIDAFCVAAWDSDWDHVMLIDENNMATGGSTRAVPYEVLARGHEKIAISTLTLDTGLKNIPNVGLITLDVEGAEARVLRGAEKTLATNRPNLVIELHEGMPGTDADLRQQVYDVLNKHDYDYHSVDITGERLICFPAENSTEPETVSADLRNAA